MNGFKNISDLKLLMTASETISNRLPAKFTGLNLDNSFVFIDAWGYQGINRDYIRSLLKMPNCSIALFFNINQIPRFITSKRYDFKKLFGNVFDKNSINKIESDYSKVQSGCKERFMLDLYMSGLTARIKDCFIIPFRFCRNSSMRTSHYMIFIVRSQKQYDELSKKLILTAECPLKQFCRSQKCKELRIKCARQM